MPNIQRAEIKIAQKHNGSLIGGVWILLTIIFGKTAVRGSLNSIINSAMMKRS